jgi:hypothetical protein
MRIPPHWLPAIRLLLLFAIFASAGPEIFAALEMATLLELLGTALFLTAFSTALKMLVADVGRWLLAFFMHPAPAISCLVMLCIVPLYLRFVWQAVGG